VIEPVITLVEVTVPVRRALAVKEPTTVEVEAISPVKG
jgi:hypothetical protein